VETGQKTNLRPNWPRSFQASHQLAGFDVMGTGDTRQEVERRGESRSGSCGP
jgi:hypothetical protein